MLNKRYANKVVIVTGGARGIGAGIATVFARSGAKVVIADIDQQQSEETVEKLLSMKAKDDADCTTDVASYQCDLCVEEDIKKLIEFTVSKFGKIDCLVNNAGAQRPLKAIDDTTLEEFVGTIRLNLLNAFLCCKYALPQLRETKGNIINISSITEATGQCGAVAYISSKTAIAGMTRALALDESSNGVRVNTVSPGAIWTELNENLARNSESYEKTRQVIDDMSLFGRCGTPEEIGELCLFLAAEATYSTGANFSASGGLELNLAEKSRLGLSPSQRMKQ